MTYKEFISQFEVHDFYDKSIDTTGMYRHHIEPRAVQKRLYGEVINHSCIVVSYADHVRCHYYYWIEHQDDNDEGYALASMMNIKREELSDLTEEEMERISESLEGFSWWTEENRRRASERQKGVYPSEETRKKLSESHKGDKAYWYGKHLSDEAIKKMVENHRGMSGKNQSEDTKNRISMANSGKVRTREMRKSVSVSKGGKSFIIYKEGVKEEFDTQWECVYWLRNHGYPKASQCAISNVLNGKRKSAYGYSFKYVDED